MIDRRYPRAVVKTVRCIGGCDVHVHLLTMPSEKAELHNLVFASRSWDFTDVVAAAHSLVEVERGQMPEVTA